MIAFAGCGAGAVAMIVGLTIPALPGFSGLAADGAGIGITMSGGTSLASDCDLPHAGGGGSAGLLR